MCNAEDCTQPHVARGLCSKHYQRWQKHGSPNARDRTPAGGPCTKEDCTEPIRSKGLCKRHYQQRWAETYRETVKAGVLPDGIRAMIRNRQLRGIPADGILFEGETAA